MEEMKDYSGPFKPDLKYEDFSKDFLIELMRVWQYFYLEMASAWSEAVEKHVGSDTATQCEKEAWVRVVKRSLPRLAKKANIELNTVLDSMKLMQLPPDNTVMMYPVDFEIKNENHVITTTKVCKGLEYWEKNNRMDRIEAMCHGTAEQELNELYAANPKVKLRPIKLPPRKSPDEPACVWEWTLEE